MDQYFGSGSGSGSASSDDLLSRTRRRLTGSPPSAFLVPAFNACSSASASSADQLSRSRRRLTASPPTAFLVPAFNACSSATSDVDPALLRLSRQHSAVAPARRVLKSSPLSQIANVGIEEEVLVIDGVLVSESKRANFPPRRNNSGEFANNSGGMTFKLELCRAWEDFGICRFGSKCQFAHGKEELRCDLRGPRSRKLKSEALGSFVSKYSPSPGSLPHNSKSCHHVSPPGPNTPDHSLAATPEWTTPAKTIKEFDPPTTTFNWPPTGEEDVIITHVLYGPSSRRRLPVFQQICPQ